jgi:hypothetical protein
VNTLRIPRFTAEASLSSRRRATVYPAMMDDGSINCGNCLGGECVELHCFENWTQGGGGPGGPYGEGGGGYGGGGGGGGGLRPCRGDDGRPMRHGTRITSTITPRGGGPPLTIRQQCRNGAWVDVGF